MNVNYSKLDDVRGELTVVIEEKDYADKVKQQLKEISKKHPEPGFRAGHVPAGILQKKYGKSVKYDVVNNAVGEAVFDYIKENNLHVLGNPVPEQNDVNLDDAELTFKFKLGLAPEFDTHVDKSLKVPYYTIQVTDEMINTQDEAFRQRLGKQEPGDTVDSTAVVKGVITELNEDGSVKEDGIVVENGIVSPAYFRNDDQKKLFEGKHVGDSLVFNPAATCDANPTEMASMLNIDKSDVDSHKGDFKFDIKEIIVLNPAEHNEEFFKTLFGENVKTEEEYREAVKQMIAQSLKGDSNFRFSIDAKNAILNAVGSLNLPDEILKSFLKSQNEALTDENIDEEYDRIRKDLEWEIIKEKVAGQLDVKVTEEDLHEMAKLIARNQLAQYGMTNATDDMLDKYASEILKDQKARNQVYSQTADMKLFAGIREAADIEDKEVSVEQFNDLFRNETSAAE